MKKRKMCMMPPKAEKAEVPTILSEAEKTEVPTILQDWKTLRCEPAAVLDPVLDFESYLRRMTEDMFVWLLRRAGYELTLASGRMMWARYRGWRQYFWYLGNDGFLHMFATKCAELDECRLSEPDPGSLLCGALHRMDGVSDEAQFILSPILQGMDGRKRRDEK